MSEKKTRAVVIGKLSHIGQVREFNSGFRKLEAVITTDGQYPQEICVEFVKDMADVPATKALGTPVEALCDIRGREYNGRWYVNLQVWKANWGDSGTQPSSAPPPPAQAQAEPEDDDLNW